MSAVADADQIKDRAMFHQEFRNELVEKTYKTGHNLTFREAFSGCALVI